MTEKRKIILADTVQTFGHEHPFTIEIFTISERCPEERFDDTLLYLYSKRCADMLVDPFEEEEEEEYNENDTDWWLV